MGDAPGAPLAVFVYGTLKRGHVNHDRFCSGAIIVDDAFTIGRLFHLAAGYPALAVQPQRVLAHGTGDLDTDLALQQEWEWRLKGERWDGAEPRVGDTEGPVRGERFVFDDPALRLRRLDRLEVFRPRRRSLYQRVLVRTWVGAERVVRPAWTYIQLEPRGEPVPSGRWEP